MIGQQLDLFGAPLRPPKKILVDEPPVEEQAATTDISAPAAETIPVTEQLVEETQPVIESDDIFEEAEAVIEEVMLHEVPETELPAESEDSVIIDETDEQEFPEIEEHELQEYLPVADNEPTLETVSTDTTVSFHERKAKPENGDQQQVVYRGRKTGDPDEEMEMLNVPADEELFKRQYYSMREAAAMFNVNQALLRFWENEFDILQPKKNKKGDRYFRPIDIKNLVLIYHLLRVRRFTLEGAKDYLHTHQKAADSFQLAQRLEKLKSFLVELKANL